MGSNSSSHQQHYHLTSTPYEMGRGWTQSFPRELNRQNVQQSLSNKVLPELPNQRLRSTNNGNIIHNGGTISGRRPSTSTLPHDPIKQGVYRSRSTSASKVGELRGQNFDRGNQHSCAGYHRPCDDNCRAEMIELKRFGSEPDLRYSPNEKKLDIRQVNDHCPERGMKERESRYRGRKKYKAPTPPVNGDESSPELYKWEIIGQDQRDYCRQNDNVVGGNIMVQAPPRRSRLFKTRAETKKQPSNWPTQTLLSQQDGNDSILENEREWRSEKQQQQLQRASGKENRPVWGDYHEQDRWSRNDRRNSKKFDGKNTVQRSLSSPEFQAELVQVARKVRNKLYHKRRIGPIGAAIITHNSEYTYENLVPKLMDCNSYNRPTKSDGQINQRREKHKNIMNEKSLDHHDRIEISKSSRYFNEKKFHEHDDNRNENRVIRRQDIHSYDKRSMDDNRDPRINGCFENGISGSRQHISERSTTSEENINNKGDIQCIFTRTPINNSADNIDYIRGDEQRQSMRLMKEINCKNDGAKTLEPFGKTRNNGKGIGHARTRSESPVMRQSRDRMDVRGQGSGRESTPEPPKGKDKKVTYNRHKRTNANDVCYMDSEKRWSERSDSKIEKYQIKSYKENNIRESNNIAKNWNLNDSHNEENSLRNARNMSQQPMRVNELDQEKNCNEDIALKLRPTLPKKQLEIPRFSPSAAWRLLSALETPGPTASSASEEVPVMYEERVGRMSRSPHSLIALGPRSSHDKSGDSGVSCDAGVPNEESIHNISTNNMKNTGSRPTWTPQQDLGEESSSDAGVDSPPPIISDAKFSTRPHVFSLSLPRDDNRNSTHNTDKPKANNTSFNSLQKMKKSVSGAFGLINSDIEKKRVGETLDDNWLLSTSAPTSLQLSQTDHMNYKNNAANFKKEWNINYGETDHKDKSFEKNNEKSEFPGVMRPPSFSYLASGGHVMYLPSSNSTKHHKQSPHYWENLEEMVTKMNNIDENSLKTITQLNGRDNNNLINELYNGVNKKLLFDEYSGLQRERSYIDLGNNKNSKRTSFSKSCENISEMRQRSHSPFHHGVSETFLDKKSDMGNTKVVIKPNPKGKRFTFQSTVRQIERRRLAEKLSREAEAKERQRKSELEAMRKVEEEFQRKRAKEKANIRQQLRLYTMDENSSLPPASDSSNLSRADPDGAPSSSASSPTSALPGKLSANNNNKGNGNNDDYQRKKECRIQQQKQGPREYKDYRIKYYDWAPNNDTSSHLEIKQTTVHPKIICDIPKSSHVFIDANVHVGKLVNSNSTPRSDNYRKDFAHGAIAGRSSLASSDSELSQPNTRPHSRQNGGNKNSKAARTRYE